MIRVIGKKTEEPKIYKVTCDNCGAQLECEESDTYVGAYGCNYVDCPECGYDAIVEAIPDVKLTEHNIEFPKHFRKTNDDAINIGDSTLQEWIRECLEKIKREEDGNFWIIASGNAVVIILKFEDEYTIYVAKDYWECSTFW
jgi:hypothetical protein